MPKPEAHIAIDIETYYDGDKEHPNGAMSLRTLSTVQYVRDPRFEFHMASIICPALGIEEPIRCIGDGEMRRFLDVLRVAEKSFDLRLVGNNSAFFDALVFKEKFGFYWKKHFDVMTMAGWVYGNRLKSRDLETIAQYLNLPGDPSRLLRAYEALGIPADAGHKKASAALAAVKGMRLDAIRDNPALLEAYSLYCDIDVTYSWQAFRQLSVDVDTHALDVADMHYRAYLEMPLQIDVPLLLNLKDDYVDTRQAEVDAFCATVAVTGVTTEGLKTFRSKDKFAKLLVDLGVSESDLPVKQGKNGAIYAFSKADLALESLVAQYSAEGDLIEEAVRLRLEYNSSMTESKMHKFALSGATGGWAFHVKPLAAPNTGRHAGGSGTGGSPQNQTRAKPMQYLSCGVGVRWKEKLTIRDIIGVPEGYELVVCDLSGIELRTGMAISDDQKYLDILKDPYNDVYCVTASDIYERTITKSDKGERQMGKLSELSCLYGCGWKKLLHTATLWGVDVTPDLIQLVHAQYRVSHPPVVETWDFFDTLLHRWASKDRFEDGESISIFEITAKGLRSPTGFLIQYPDLEVSVRPFGRKFVRSYTYWNAARRSRANVHRGLVLENCIAAGSEVLTETRGWVAIETLQPDERVWNGDCWCSHKGLSYNNIQTTIDVQGVRLTPDHLVLTDSGWEKAENVGNKGVLYAKHACSLSPTRYPYPRLKAGVSRARLMTTADKPVYDIKDVEHGNKFMVRPAGGGAPQIVHNCSQHAAGAVFNDMMVRIERRATEVGGLFCGDVHDEMIYRAPVGLGGEVLKIMQEEMKVPPVWWPELPVTSEGEHGFGILETDTGFTMASRYGMLK